MSGLWSLVYVMVLWLAASQAELVQIVTPEVTTEEPGGKNMTTTKRDATPPLDSYLQALKVSQGPSNRFDAPREPEDVFYNDEEHRGGEAYGPPQSGGYAPPQSQANGPPQSEGYAPPQSQAYGPPQGYLYNDPSSYHSGPKHPSPAYMYGPPSPISYTPQYQPPSQPFPNYGTPFAAPHNPLMTMLPNLLPKGLDLETVFKILLKFVLFKLIVKFIAVTCLLFLWPLFQSKEKESESSEDEERQFEALNELTELVWRSIYKAKQDNNTMVQNEEADENIIEKVAGQINEKMTVPSEEAAIGFLEFCVSAANNVVGWMMSFLRRRNNEIDPLEELLWSLWRKIKSMVAAKIVTA